MPKITWLSDAVVVDVLDVAADDLRPAAPLRLEVQLAAELKVWLPRFVSRK